MSRIAGYGLIVCLAGNLRAQTFVAPGDTGSIEYPIENDATSDKPVDAAELELYPTPPAHFIVKGTSIRGPDTIPPAAVKSFVIDYEIAADAPEGSFTIGLKPKAETANVTPPWADLYTQVTFGVAEHVSVMDYTNILTLETLLNYNLTILHQYVHAERLCHTTEGTWEGPFYTERWSKVCQDTHGQNYCLEWTGGGCCMYCASRTDTHRGYSNLGKAFPPGTYTQLLKSDSYVPPVDDLAHPLFHIRFSPTDFPDINSRDHLSASSPSLGADDVWAITVIIPDKGQTAKLRKTDTLMGEPESGDDQEAVLGLALPKPIKVKAIKTVGATGVDGSLIKTEQPLIGVQIQFTVKDPYGNVVGNVLTAETQPDGIASISGVMLGSNPGTYTIEANCGQCFANRNVIFTATAEAIRTIIEKVPGAESGDRQKDRVGTQLPIPLRVRVKDTDGTLRSGVQVNFSVLESPAAASFSDPNPVTDEMGVASTLFTLGDAAGHYEIEAFCSLCTGNAANGTASPANHAASSAAGPTGSDARVRLGQDADTEKVSDKLPGKKGPRASTGACFAEILQLPHDVQGVEEPAILRAPEPMLACAGSDVQLKCHGVHNVNSLSTKCEGWGLVPNKSGVAVSQDGNSRAFFNSLLPEVFTVHVTRKTTLKPSVPGGNPTEVTCIAEREVSVAQVVLGDPTVSPFLGKQGEFNAAPRGAQFAVSVPVALQGVNVDLREYVRLTVAAYDMDGTLLAEQSERKKGWMVENDVIHLNYTIPSSPESVFRLRIRIDACNSGKDVWFQVHPKVTFP